MCVGLWNKFCFYVPVGYFAIGNKCSLVFVSSYVYGVFGAQRSRDCTVTVLVSQIKRGHVTAL